MNFYSFQVIIINNIQNLYICIRRVSCSLATKSVNYRLQGMYAHLDQYLICVFMYLFTCIYILAVLIFFCDGISVMILRILLHSQFLVVTYPFQYNRVVFLEPVWKRESSHVFKKFKKKINLLKINFFICFGSF